MFRLSRRKREHEEYHQRKKYQVQSMHVDDSCLAAAVTESPCSRFVHFTAFPVVYPLLIRVHANFHTDVLYIKKDQPLRARSMGRRNSTRVDEGMKA